MGELTNLIAGKLVAFDTAPLIYYIEEHPHYLPIVDELFNAFDWRCDDTRGHTVCLTTGDAREVIDVADGVTGHVIGVVAAINRIGVLVHIGSSHVASGGDSWLKSH